MACIADNLPFPDFATRLPVADRTGLVGLSVREFRAWTVVRAKEYRRFALALLALHNTIAPIHSLPNEILSRIFTFSWRDRNSFCIAHVCRRWRQVLLTTREFWADAVEGEYLHADDEYCDPPEYIATILQRSAPLHIQPDFVGLTGALSDMLQLHLWRFTSLSFDLTETYEVRNLHNVLSKGMPALERLTVKYEPEYCSDNGFGRCQNHHHDNDGRLHGLKDLEAHLLPRLAEADIPSFFSSKVAVPSLLKLRLHRIKEHHNNPTTDIDELLSALARCPKLEHLELIAVLHNWEPAESSQMEVVTLPALQSFCIEDRLSDVAAFLPHVICPSIASVRVDGSVLESYSSTTARDANMRGLMQSSSLVSTILEGVNSVTIRIGSTSTVLQCYVDKEERLHFETDVQFNGNNFNAFADALRSGAMVTELTWISTRYFIFAECVEDMRYFFRGLRDLRTLTMSGGEAEGFLSVLRPSEDATAQELVCPLLEELTLRFLWSGMEPEDNDGPLDAEEAASQLSARCAQIESVLAPRASRFSSRLTYLKFDEWDDEISEDSEMYIDVTPKPMSPPLVAVESPLQSLRDLVVDGYVIFGGFNLRRSYF